MDESLWGRNTLRRQPSQINQETQTMPTIKELAQATRLKEAELQQLLEPFSLDVDKHPWKTLTVAAGKTVTVDAGSAAWKASCVQIKPRDVDHLRELIGIPQRVYTKRVRPQVTSGIALSALPHLSAASLASRMTHRIAASELQSISPTATMAALKGENKATLRRASENLVYGKVSAASKGTPLYVAAHKDLLRRVIPILILRDIVVEQNATLVLSTSLAGLLAFRVRIFKGGRVVTPTYAKIHCHTVESNL